MTIADARPRCSAFIATSIDGFVARDDGTIDWLAMVSAPGEDYGYAQFFESIDALVIGKNTYRTALGFDAWPYAGKRCVVLAHDAIESKHGEERHVGDPAPLLARLRREGVTHVYVDGGEVIRRFLADGLLDAMTISVVPILLGSGARLFDRGAERSLRLRAGRVFASGLVQSTYEIA